MTTTIRSNALTTKTAIRWIRIGIGVFVIYCVAYMFLRYESASLQDGDISMAPAIPAGEPILIDTFVDEEAPYEVGQIVLYRAQFGNRSVLRLGRIVAGEGEVLSEKDGVLYSDDRSLEAASSQSLELGKPLDPQTFVILVENPDLRLYPDPGFPDSRLFGPIPLDKIVGRYIMHGWSFPF